MGKSSLIHAFISGEFHEDHLPILTDSHRMRLSLSGEIHTFQMQDTHGLDDCERMVHFGMEFDAALLCFSSVSRRSLDNLEKWVENIRRMNTFAPIVLVSTKTDLYQHGNVEHVSTDEGNRIKERVHAFRFCNTSSLLFCQRNGTRGNIRAAFITVLAAKVGGQYFFAQPHCSLNIGLVLLSELNKLKIFNILSC